MKKVIIILALLSLNLFALGDVKSSLKSIAQYAMVIGKGKASVSFVFLDPLCPFSREFITSISTNKAMQEKTTYYIYLYKLPKKSSDRLIKHIYESENPLDTMKKVMVYKQDVTFKATKKSAQALVVIEAIAKVAKKVNV
jgi:thioredoxin-related protein